MKNFYQVLEISETSNQQEIKKAYVKLLRKYPPEKNPEEYKTIREAYDILRDEESRKNYDISLKCGGEIQELEEKGAQALKEKDYDNAIECFSKILKINDDSNSARNSLGRAYLLKKKYKKAMNEYILLADRFPDNMQYMCSLGFTFEMMDKIEKAEKLYQKAYKFDITDKETMDWLIQLYWKQKRYEEVEKVLKRDIEADGEIDFNDYYCYSKLIENYIYMGEEYKILDLVKDIKQIIPNDPQIRDNISWDFRRLGNLLYEVKRYEVAEILYRLAKIASPEDDSLDSAVRNSHLYKLTNHLLEDDDIEGILKGPIYYYMHHNDVTQEEREENTKKVFENLGYFNKEYAQSLEESLQIFIEYYEELYLEVKDFYDEIIKLNNFQLSLIDEFEYFLSEPRIPDALRMCIVALADGDDNEFEKSYSNLKMHTINDVKKGILVIKNEYPCIEEKYNNFVTHIKEIIF